MITRLAKIDDLPSLKKLYEEFYAYNAALQSNYYVPAIENGDYPQSVINGGCGNIFIAETEGIVVGFIHVEISETPPFPSVMSHKYASIIDFFVKQSYRRLGIGNALLKCVKEWANEEKLDYIELLVLDENTIGKKFYELEGFQTSSRTMRYVL